MNKILVFIVLGLFMVSCVTAYYCIDDSDNIEVQEFKAKVNTLAVKSDLANGVTPEAIKLKLKYFSGCR